MLEILEINPKSAPDASVIWMHGLGASGHDFFDIVPDLNLLPELNVRFVFPHAPVRPVACCGNERVRAWFDVFKLDPNAEEDEAGFRASEALLGQLIAKEMELNIPSNKIVLAGFSQGGAMALQCGLRYDARLAGILVLSAWLPLRQTVVSERNSANQETPILMLHGTQDELISLDWAKKSSDCLREIGYDAKLISYPMGHSVCSEEIVAIGDWLNKLLS